MDSVFKKFFNRNAIAKPEQKIFKGLASKYFTLLQRSYKAILFASIVMGLVWYFSQLLFITWLSLPISTSGSYPSLYAWLILLFALAFKLILFVFILRIISGILNILNNSEMPELSFVNIWRHGKNIYQSFLFVAFVVCMGYLLIVLPQLGRAGLNLYHLYEGTSYFGDSLDQSNLFWSLLTAKTVIAICGGLFVMWLIKYLFGFFAITCENYNFKNGTKRGSNLISGHKMHSALLILLGLIVLNIPLWIVSVANVNKLWDGIHTVVWFLTVLLGVIFLLSMYKKLSQDNSEVIISQDKDSLNTKIINAILIFIFVLLTGFDNSVFYLNSATRDDKELDMNEMSVETIDFDVNDNVYNILFETSADNKVRFVLENDVASKDSFIIKTFDQYIEKGQWDYSAVKDLIEKDLSNKMLDLFEETLKYDEYQAPNQCSSDYPSIPLTGLREMARIRALKARLDLENNINATPLEDMVDVVEFGQKFQDGQRGNLIQLLVGYVIEKNTALTMINKMLSDFSFSKNDLQIVLSSLGDKPSATTRIRPIMQCEQAMRISGQENLLNLKVENYYWLPNNCRNRDIDTARQFLRLVDTSPLTFRNQYGSIELQTPRQDIITPFAVYRKNLVCDILHSYWDTQSVYWKSLEVDWARLSTKINIASLLYQKDHRAMPETLADLVPDYLTSLPIDPFDNQAVRYNQETGTIYSVGINIIDEQGAGDDLVLPLAKNKK